MSILKPLEKLATIDLAKFCPDWATRTEFVYRAVFVIRRAKDQIAVIGMHTAAARLWHGLEAVVLRS
jgi:hypothetical protein